ITKFFHRDSSPVEQSQQQVCKRRLIRNTNVLASFDPPHTTAKDGSWKRKMVMSVAIAHVAAENEDRMIQHGAVAVRHLRQFCREFGEHVGVIRLNFSK